MLFVQLEFFSLTQTFLTALYLWQIKQDFTVVYEAFDIPLCSNFFSEILFGHIGPFEVRQRCGCYRFINFLVMKTFSSFTFAQLIQGSTT